MFIDLVQQVQRILRLEHGGLGNRYGLARGVVFRARNQSGASMPVGSTVKRTAYAFEIVELTTATDDSVIGVSVGDVDVETDEIDGATATANGGTVAVAVGGVVQVRLGADVTAGQYAFAHATDGTAYGSATVSGSFGQFLTSGLAGNKAAALLKGVGDHDHDEYATDSDLTTHAAASHGDPGEDTQVWMPLTTVVSGVPELVWDADDSLIPTLVPLE